MDKGWADHILLSSQHTSPSAQAPSFEHNRDRHPDNSPNVAHGQPGPRLPSRSLRRRREDLGRAGISLPAGETAGLRSGPRRRTGVETRSGRQHKLADRAEFSVGESPQRDSSTWPGWRGTGVERALRRRRSPVLQRRQAALRTGPATPLRTPPPSQTPRSLSLVASS